ncbi:Spo11/DNA topoisomerase VI, subunit A protein [Prunus dulcis]|uniref:Spo11/DNA topoisomerase VI, subunit A protein n=1 Tax=Prunus dulcis TaxID=3755 RepID=A0A4Y1QN19_PRUDU|nr:Spo11/DNA topoisomerase VI, subunit A protein [Prunus dulcis]
MLLVYVTCGYATGCIHIAFYKYIYKISAEHWISPGLMLPVFHPDGFSGSTILSYACILFVLLTIYKQCFIGKSQYIKKREIYYTDTNQFKSEYDAYGVIDYVLCVLIHIRLSLRVIGQFTFVCDDTPHDCSSSAEEIASCYRIVCTSFNSCDASFILLVEKNTVFHGLAQVKFHENAKCIMVSGKGYGDRSTKQRKVVTRSQYINLNDGGCPLTTKVIQLVLKAIKKS